MSTLDTGLTLIRNASQRVSRANGWMGNAFKSWMPTGLYARALLIMIVPMVILQSVVAFVFMERHWNTVTRRLSAAVVQDVAALTGGGTVNERAVDVQINRLRRKIERDPANPLFLQAVRGIGYRLVASP